MEKQEDFALKQSFAHHTSNRLSRNSKQRCGRLALAILLAITLMILPLGSSKIGSFNGFFKSASNESNNYHEHGFDWNQAVSRPYLDYAKCYDAIGDFECARLELPMDYWNDTTNDTISLAVIRRPARVPVTDPRYGGAIQVNPGGPGGSGVGLVLGGGEEISWSVDTQDEQMGLFFDILSFDPRGVGFSTPRMQCFDDPCVAKSWNLRLKEVGVLGSSDASVGRKWSMDKAKGQSCSLPPYDEKADIKRYMTTASVARDMVSLVEAHGEWRQKEGLRLMKEVGERRYASPASEVWKYRQGLEKLQYWGFSYGTYLGMTFAAMFPDRVGRVIVDGVVDAEDYKKALWFDNLEDTEKDVDQFYSNCARVGYPGCALANSTGTSTAHGVKSRVQNITASLYHNPLPVIIQGNPEVVTFADVEAVMFASLYTPIQSFPFVARMLHEIEQGDGRNFAAYNSWAHDVSCDGESRTLHLAGDALMGIACSDGDDQSWLDKPEFEKFLKKLQKLSPSIGALWAEVRLSCVHYGIRPEYRFTGPWVGNTSHPILLIGNTADPVTPLRNAIKMAEGFQGAVALTQDSPGHCSSSAPSMCTVGWIRKYFQNGELPPANTTCNVDELPFGPGPDDRTATSTWENSDAKDRMSRLNAAMHAAGGGFMGKGYISRPVQWTVRPFGSLR